MSKERSKTRSVRRDNGVFFPENVVIFTEKQQNQIKTKKRYKINLKKSIPYLYIVNNQP